MNIEKVNHLDDLRDVSEGNLRARIPMAQVEVAELHPGRGSYQFVYEPRVALKAIKLHKGKFLVYAYGRVMVGGNPNLVYATHLNKKNLKRKRNLPDELFLTPISDLRGYRAINPRKPLKAV